MLLKVEFNRIAASLFLFPLKVMMYSVLNDPMTVTQRGLSLLSCAQGTRRCHVKILSYVADLAVSKVSSKQLPQLRKRLPQLRKKTKKTKKKRRVIVIGDSFLRGTEGPICRPDPSPGKSAASLGPGLGMLRRNSLVWCGLLITTPSW